MKNVNRKQVRKFMTDYFFLLLLLAGIVVNYYFEMKVNKSIKKFTAGQETVQQNHIYAEQVLNWRKRIGGIENYTRNFIITGDSAFLRTRDQQIDLLNRELVLTSEIPGAFSSAQDWISFKTLVREKINFEKDISGNFILKGPDEARRMLQSAQYLRLEEKLNKAFSGITGRITEENLRLTTSLRKEKVDLISLDYAIPHLTSFLFLVIAGFMLFKIFQVYALNRNLSEAVKKEKDAQLLKEQFMDNMTHELRSPLNSILGYTGLLQKSKLRDDQAKFVKSIRTAGELLMNVINEVLDHSKLKSGYVHFSDEPFSLREQLNALSDILSDKLSQKGLEFEYDIDDEIPDTLSGDGPKLLQVLLNITFNAIKFTPAGRITITATCKKKVNDKVTILFTISDTGIGIPADKLPHIFERFYQVGGAQSGPAAGTGLGLSITRQLVTQQGGTIQVESEVGKGTTFYFELPYRIRRAEETVAAAADEAATGAETLPEQQSKHTLPSKMLVLVVDDNALNRDLTGYMLKDFGVGYQFAGSGMQALERLREGRHFDVVLMDLQMPGMDGKETTRRIREELKSNIPIIALTAFAQSAEKQKCLESGMDAYLSKPVQEKELYEALEMFVGHEVNSGPFFNIDYLKNIARGNDEFVESVILRVADSLPREIESLKAALRQADATQVKQISHDLKTTFAVLGVNELVAEPISYFEAYGTVLKEDADLEQMMQKIENIGAEITFSLLDHFSPDHAKAAPGSIHPKGSTITG